LAKNDRTEVFEKIVSLSKRRGFVYPSSEIYGGLGAIYDYGHYGALLKDNIKNSWQKDMVQLREDVYGLDSAIFMHPKAWVASGHVGGFTDPQVDCKQCKNRMRADKLLEEFGIKADKESLEFINTELDKLRKTKKLKCNNCGSVDITKAKIFSLMVKSNLGSPTEELCEENVVYLRPETCGGIYLEYKNIMDTLHPKLPFGVAQVGKAFRNEIVARQFIFRTREFEQMEMQYFLAPSDMKKSFEMWKKIRWNWYLSLGFPEETLKWHKHEKLAHYATEAFDIEYNFKSLGGFDEIEGLHTRGDWDLTQHSKFSGVDLTYTDPTTQKKFMPNIMETSAGLNRILFAVMDLAYTEEKIGEETRIVMKFPRNIAPIKVAVFPLLKNKPELVQKAKEIFDMLKTEFVCEFDDNGNIGKRYRRQDEIGTPICITIDFDTLENNTVTVRDRDTMKQDRIAIDQLLDHTKELLAK
jgi:glycyl-tRNA synthetase